MEVRVESKSWKIERRATTCHSLGKTQTLQPQSSYEVSAKEQACKQVWMDEGHTHGERESLPSVVYPLVTPPGSKELFQGNAYTDGSC